LPFLCRDLKSPGPTNYVSADSRSSLRLATETQRLPELTNEF
jgi:hypothetical protein